LLEPAAYPEQAAGVELVEARISNLFFTGRHVHKVKKPVDFGFLRWIQSPGNLARGEV
jgi:aminoglycoside phosphotransferase family enzyme